MTARAIALGRIWGLPAERDSVALSRDGAIHNRVLFPVARGGALPCSPLLHHDLLVYGFEDSFGGHDDRHSLVHALGVDEVPLREGNYSAGFGAVPLEGEGRR